MSRPVLVDSSWYIDQSRQGRDPLRVLAFLAESRDIATCGLIAAEVGRGLRDRRWLDAYQRAWSAMLYLESSRARWQETLDLAWSLDRQGILVPIQDLHIAALALHAGAVVLTCDHHFQQVPGLDATDRVL
jgi:predicted nucleic acid-binding protein